MRILPTRSVLRFFDDFLVQVFFLILHSVWQLCRDRFCGVVMLVRVRKAVFNEQLCPGFESSDVPPAPLSGALSRLFYCPRPPNASFPFDHPPPRCAFVGATKCEADTPLAFHVSDSPLFERELSAPRASLFLVLFRSIPVYSLPQLSATELYHAPIV